MHACTIVDVPLVGFDGMCMLRSLWVLIACIGYIVHCMAWWSWNRDGGTLGPQYLDGDPIVGKDVVTLIRKGNIGGGTLGPRVGTAFAYVVSCCESHA